MKAKDWSKYQGKILRLNLDGSIPADNPLINGVRSHVFSYGHRNPLGLVVRTERRDLRVGARAELRRRGQPDRRRAQLRLAECRRLSRRQERTCTQTGRRRARRRARRCRGGERDPRVGPDADRDVVEQPAVHAAAAHVLHGRNGLTTCQASAARRSRRAASTCTWATAIPGLEELAARAQPDPRRRLSAEARARRQVGQPARPVEVFPTANRYRDIALNPDGRTIYLATDPEGPNRDASGSARGLANPGSILEFTYTWGIDYFLTNFTSAPLTESAT